MKDSTKDLIEDVIVQNLRDIQAMCVNEQSIEYVKQTGQLITIQKEIEEAEAKVLDAEERRRIEEKKTDELTAVENRKLKWSKISTGLTLGVGALVALLNVGYDWSKHVVDLDFERENVIKSHAVRTAKFFDFGKFLKK